MTTTRLSRKGMKTMKLTPKLVGARHFDDRLVTVTDPCYSSGWSGFAIPIRVKPGDYDCVAWKGRSRYKTGDGKYCSYTRVWICGIYLDGNVGGEDDFEETGVISVDAGLAGFFQEKPDYNEEWFSLCDMVHKKEYLIVDEGFLTESGIGDGMYPVYARKNKDGEITALEIRF